METALTKPPRMFRDPTTHPLTPHPKTARLEVSPHHFNYRRLNQTSFFMNFIKRCPILPCHSDHSVSEVVVHYRSINLFLKNASRDDS